MSYINIIVPGAEYVSKESKISGDKAQHGNSQNSICFKSNAFDINTTKILSVL